MQNNPMIMALLFDIQNDINYMKRLLEKLTEMEADEDEEKL